MTMTTSKTTLLTLRSPTSSVVHPLTAVPAGYPHFYVQASSCRQSKRDSVSARGGGSVPAVSRRGDVNAAMSTEVWFAPGRANLMGEHTDYNEGFVLPFALAQGVTATAAARDDGLLVLRSKQKPAEPVTVPLDSLAPR